MLHHIDASVAFISFTPLSMYSNEVRIVANHHKSNIAKVYATQTLQTIMLTFKQ